MENISKNDAIQMLFKVGNLASVTILVKDKHEEEKPGYVLNNGMVYEPNSNSQRGMSYSQLNAERAVDMILKNTTEFKVFSSYFSWATGKYNIVDF